MSYIGYMNKYMYLNYLTIVKCANKYMKMMSVIFKTLVFSFVYWSFTPNGFVWLFC